ncbi:MAG: hypothetical protein LUE98_11170 [Tannerellaceae bacterium]|nr:hypothetical protein [Tannerellaceae bacterium]
MKKIFVVILMFQLTICMANASLSDDLEKVNAEIRTKSGIVYKGEITMPYVNSESIDLFIGNVKQTIKSSDIEEMRTWKKGARENSAVKLVYQPSFEYKSIRDEKPEVNDQPKWMVSLVDLENLELFMISQQYNINQHYSRPVDYLMEGIAPNLWVYVQRPDELYPTRISLSPGSGYGSNQHFRAVGAKYFQDCEELSDKIQNGEITNDSLIDAILFYSDWKKNN